MRSRNTRSSCSGARPPPGRPCAARWSRSAISTACTAATGLDGAIVLRFDAALAQLSAQDFVADILVGRFAVAGVAIGFDFHFGLKRAGSPDYLKAEGAQLGFAVDIVPR